MAQEVINIGTLPNDGKGDTLRVATQKINNNFTQLFSTPLVADNLARQRANSAFDAANTKISKTGDIVTGKLIFTTNAENTSANTKIGNIFEANGIDIFASNENEFAELNWANLNFVIADSVGLTMATSNTSVEVKDVEEDQRVLIRVITNTWAFGSNGRIILFDSSTAEKTTIAPGFRNTILVNTSTHNASNTNDIIICDPNAAGVNVNINLSANADNGKIFTIKNANPGGRSVKVNGTERAFPYIENPTTGTFVTTVTMSQLGEVYTWVFESGVYRYIE